ncbi:glycosyltransferase [candidate division NPL-UPA2 bacterium]|nr:glycosyltransferase [candidate division NPL-UPA2 bacterium]
MITILHTESSRQWGGQEQRILSEARELKKRGYRVIIACRPDSRILPRANEAGVEACKINIRSSFSLRAFLRLILIMHREKVDIVNTHSSKDSWLASLAARLTTRSKLIRTRHVSIPIPRHPFNIVYRLPHKIMTCGVTIRQAMIRDNGLEPGKIVSIPTGVDLQRFDFSIDGTSIRKEFGIKPDAPLVGTVGIIRSEKGHFHLIKAIQQVLEVKPETRLLIVGDEPKGDTVRRQIKELGLEKQIIMTGLRDDIPQVLAALNIFVLPSLREGVPQAVAQALAMKKAVVATAVGGVPELIENERTGILVPPQDVEALSEAMVELLDDREKARRLGENGRRFIEEKFSLEGMVEKIESLYRDLLR